MESEISFLDYYYNLLNDFNIIYNPKKIYNAKISNYFYEIKKILLNDVKKKYILI